MYMNKYKDISVDVNVVLNVLFISVHHELDISQGMRTATYLLWLAYMGNIGKDRSRIFIGRVTPCGRYVATSSILDM
jgi:hypothetical protein